jgi:protein-arginine kinase activator protein McsA
MMSKSFLFFCENCSYRKIIKNNDDLKIFKIIKSSQIQKTVPIYDIKAQETKKSDYIDQPKKLKCPKCGFSFRTKLIKEEQNEPTNKTDNINGC